jgi:hypothetical protein
MRFFAKILKGITLYITILAVVTAGAAIIGCLFLPNGRLDYLLDPSALFTFVWVTRAGLKVTIMFVTTLIFLLFAENGALSQRWFRRPQRTLPPASAKEAWTRPAVVELAEGQRFRY